MFRTAGGAASSQAAASSYTEAERAQLKKRTRQVLLATGMMVSGAANTITNKMAFETVAPGRADGALCAGAPCTEPHKFDHPFVQAGAMFAGELSVLLYYHLRERCKAKRPKAEPFPKYAFALPAACDIAGTCIMYLGLTMTSASTYQMLRGSVVIFTALFSAVFLRRRQRGFHALGLALVFGGALVVGTASSAPAAGGDAPTSKAAAVAAEAAMAASATALVGDALVVLSQIATATQMCLEERFLTGRSLPTMLAVGWEGFWGSLLLPCLLVALQLARRPDGSPLEDTVDALAQARAAPRLVLLLVGNALSVAFFNGFGMAITKESSAAYRMVLDSCRTVLVWGYGLGTGAESFHALQVGGFVLMLGGAAVYNEALRVPCLAYPDAAEVDAELQAAAALRAKRQPLLGAGPQHAPSPTFPSLDDIYTPKLSRLGSRDGR